MENLEPSSKGSLPLPIFNQLFGFSQLKKTETLKITTDGKITRVQKNRLKAPTSEELKSDLKQTQEAIQIFSHVTSLLQGSQAEHPDKSISKSAKNIYKIASKNLNHTKQAELSKEIKLFIAAQMSTSLKAGHSIVEETKQKETKEIQEKARLDQENTRLELYEKLNAVEATSEGAIKHLLESMHGVTDVPTSMAADILRYSSTGKIKFVNENGDDLLEASSSLVLPAGLTPKEVEQETLKAQFTTMLDVFLEFLAENKEIPDEKSNEIREAWQILSSATGAKSMEARVQDFFMDMRAGKIGEEKGENVSKLMLGMYQNVHQALVKSILVNLIQFEPPEGVSNRVKIRSKDTFISYELNPDGAIKITHEIRMINKDHDDSGPRNPQDNSYETECRYEITAHHELEGHVSNLDEWKPTLKVGIGMLSEREQRRDLRIRLFLDNMDLFFDVAGYNPYFYERSKKVIV